MKYKSRITKTMRCAVPALLLTLAYGEGAKAQAPKLRTTTSCSPPPANKVYRIQLGGTPNVFGTYPRIEADNSVNWSATPATSSGCAVNPSGGWVCAGLNVTLKTNPASETNYFSGSASTVEGTSQVLRVTAAGGSTCTENFTFMATSDAGGWGDPHLITVDGVHYDFQSAGEFTALIEDGFEVQTRQSPVPTATVPITNPYTGITHCVAIYTAVAAKLGSSRVTVQPNPVPGADTQMQVRLNGEVLTLGDAPHLIYAGGNEKGAIEGTIISYPEGMVEFRDARGTQLVVSSKYWDARQVYYLTVNIYGTSAHKGTMGKLAERSWLPALPDGSSVGAKPDAERERYQVLYEKFADAWRVTDATSLFDYEPGTNTATFTRDEWPRSHPESCAIEGQISAQTVTEQVAELACANVVDATRKADCVFDVKVTGNEGFAKSYEVAQRFSPLSPGWYSPVPSKCLDCPPCKECLPPPEQPWWCCWLDVVLGLTVLVLLILVFRARKKP